MFSVTGQMVINQFIKFTDCDKPGDQSAAARYYNGVHVIMKYKIISRLDKLRSIGTPSV